MTETTENFHELMNSTSESQNISILDLNDDCLMKIFEYLSIYELIDAEKVCTIFKQTCFDVYNSKKFHKLRIELRNLQTEHFKAIFDRIGDSLKHFEFSGGYIMNEDIKQALIDGVTMSCSKLKSLSINYIQFSTENFAQLQKSFFNLTTLDLSRCGLSESALDNVQLDGEKLKSIKTLKLAGNSCIVGTFFNKMINVESLDISYCYSLSFFEFLEFLKNCKKLVDLNVSASCKLVTEDENFIETLWKYQPNLENLIMENTGVVRNEQIMMKFKNLKFASFEGRKFGT